MDEITDIKALLLDLGHSEHDIQRFEDVLQADTGFVPDVDRSNMPPIVKESRAGMSLEHLTLDLEKMLSSGMSDAERVKKSDEIRVKAEKRAEAIIKESVRAEAWELDPARTLEVGAVRMGGQVFSGKPKKKAPPKPQKGALMSFDIDMSAVDDFIKRASGAVLFTKKESGELRDLIYDKTAMEMVRSSISDFLMEEYSRKNKERGNILDNTFTYVITKYSQTIHISDTMIRRLIRISNNSLSKYNNLGYSSYFKPILEDSMVLLKNVLSGLNALRALTYTSMASLGRVSEKSMNVKKYIDLVLEYKHNLQAIENSANDVLARLKSKMSQQDVMNLLKKMDLEGDLQYRYYAYKRNIFSVIEDGISGIISIINDFMTLVAPFEFPKIDESKSSGFVASPVSESRLFAASFTGKKNDITQTYKVVDDIDTAFKAIGIEGKMIGKLRARISQAVFGRKDLDDKVDRFVRERVILNFMRAIS